MKIALRRIWLILGGIILYATVWAVALLIGNVKDAWLLVQGHGGMD